MFAGRWCSPDLTLNEGPAWLHKFTEWILPSGPCHSSPGLGSPVAQAHPLPLPKRLSIAPDKQSPVKPEPPVVPGPKVIWHIFNGSFMGSFLPQTVILLNHLHQKIIQWAANVMHAVPWYKI
jgi:hypothetical protein